MPTVNLGGELGGAWPVRTGRLTLTPLRASDADEMFSVLNDMALHSFIGGEPRSLVELKARYARLEPGSGRESEIWLNWTVRLRSDGKAVGAVQATIVTEPELRAEVAWTIGTPWQRRGCATEAATALFVWLRSRGVQHFQAHIHPDHQASTAVARRLGMHPTHLLHDGETLWETLAD